MGDELGDAAGTGMDNLTTGLVLLALVLLLVLAYQIYAVCRQSSALLGTELSSSAARGGRAAKGRERKKEKYGRTKRDDAQASTGLVCSDEGNAVLRDEDDEQEL